MTEMPARRALFIVPPTGKYIREDRCQTPIKELKTIALRPPTDLLYSAAAWRSAGGETRVVDYPGQERGWEDLAADLREFQPDFLFMSITTPSLADDMKAAEVCRRESPRTLTAAKGAHFNIHDLRSLEEFPQLDLCLRGEYEETCMDLARGVLLADCPGISWRNRETGEVRRNAERPLIQNLDTLPFPARDLVNNGLYVRPDTSERQATLVTNRGCPYTCIYCLAQQVSGSRNRYRSVENVLAEIRECVERHGIRNFLFRSDLFTQNKKWVRDLCQGILDGGLDIEWACNSRVDSLDRETLEMMKKAGCWIIAFGVESGIQESLDRMRKKSKVEDAYATLRLCREVGVKSSIYILMGFPWDTRESIEENMRFARAVDPDIMEIFYIYPFPGTDLYKLAVEEGLLVDGTIPKAAYDSPCMPTKTLSVEELARMRRRAMRDFYLRPRTIARTLAGARSPRAMANYLKYGAIQMWDLVAGDRRGREAQGSAGVLVARGRGRG